MPVPPLQIVRVLGIPIRLHWSWFLAVALVTWTLAAGYFPAQLPDASAGRVWLYGLVATLLLFGSVLLHELSHAVVARRVGVPVSGITLFVFGGAAQMAREPDSPRAEFLMAVVGPLTSYAVALGCWLTLGAWSPALVGESLLLYLGAVNVVIGTFNLVPGFPLDGGRLLRSALWAWRRDLAWATRMASYAGSAFGFVLVGWGGLRVFGGELIGGTWLLLMGMFLQQAASGSYAQFVARRSLGRVSVDEAMTREVVTVPAGATLGTVVDHYFWPHHVTSFPVVEGPGQAVLGVVTIGHVKQVPRERWPSTTAADVMVRLHEDLTIPPSASCWDALAKLNRNGVGRLAVVQAGRLVGYLSVRDVAHLLMLEAARGDGAVGQGAEPAAARPPRDRAA
jgi:Zn-dependent protease/CBS domain-containing protein